MQDLLSRWSICQRSASAGPLLAQAMRAEELEAAGGRRATEALAHGRAKGSTPPVGGLVIVASAWLRTCSTVCLGQWTSTGWKQQERLSAHESGRVGAHYLEGVGGCKQFLLRRLRASVQVLVARGGHCSAPHTKLGAVLGTFSFTSERLVKETVRGQRGVRSRGSCQSGVALPPACRRRFGSTSPSGPKVLGRVGSAGCCSWPGPRISEWQLFIGNLQVAVVAEVPRPRDQRQVMTPLAATWRSQGPSSRQKLVLSCQILT